MGQEKQITEKLHWNMFLYIVSLERYNQNNYWFRNFDCLSQQDAWRVAGEVTYFFSVISPLCLKVLVTKRNREFIFLTLFPAFMGIGLNSWSSAWPFPLSAIQKSPPSTYSLFLSPLFTTLVWATVIFHLALGYCSVFLMGFPMAQVSWKLWSVNIILVRNLLVVSHITESKNQCFKHDSTISSQSSMLHYTLTSSLATLPLLFIPLSHYMSQIDILRNCRGHFFLKSFLFILSTTETYHFLQWVFL